jgi:D-aminoacyl-tRNA deacylase
MFPLIGWSGDAAAMNMREKLLQHAEWEEAGEFQGEPVHRLGDKAIMFVSDQHMLGYDDFDKDMLGTGLFEEGDVQSFIVLSRHRSESGHATLTVHPIGNWHQADYGGRPETVVTPAPFYMTEALRLIMKHGEDLEGFSISFEATHHGPWIASPVFFIEIGSDESKWGLPEPGNLMARVLLELFDTPEKDYPVCIGAGGGHYAPRMTDIARDYKASIGHMIPNYALTDDAVVDLALEMTPGASFVYIHKKSMKGVKFRHYRDLFEEKGLPVRSSKELEPLD